MSDDPPRKQMSRRSETLIFIALMLLIVASTFISYTAIETVKITLNRGQPMTLKEWAWGSVISLVVLFAFVWWFKIPLKAVNGVTE